MTRRTPSRLSRSDDVRRALKEGQRRSGGLMAVHGRARVPQDSDGARLTVVASRRAGNAVQRNRAKRLLREAARSQHWRTGYDVVLVARRDCTASALAPVTAELTTLAGRLGMLEADR